MAGADKNRSHGKIDKLPEEIRKEVETKLLEGYTYEQISEYLHNMGHNIHYSSVHRFGKPFLKKFENVRMAKEYAQLLAEDNALRPTTELHEANNAIISQIVMGVLVDEDIAADEKIKAAQSVATLQRAQVSNEKLKLQSRKEAGAVKTAMALLKAKIFEEISSNHPEIANAIIKIANEVEKEVQAV